MILTKKVSKNTLTLAFISIVLIALSVFSYVTFSNIRYEIKQTPNKSASSQGNFFERLPAPEGYTILSTNISSDSNQITIQTTKDMEVAYDFYKNVFISVGWELKKESSEVGSKLAKFDKDGTELVLNVTYDYKNKTSVVNIESKRD